MKKEIKVQKAKQGRNSLAMKIAAESDLHEKLDIALGQCPRFRLFKKPETKDIPAILRQAKFLCHQLKAAKGKSRSELMSLSASMWTFALCMMTPIVDGDFKFFSRLAAAMQYRKTNAPDERYRDIIQFCIGDGYNLSGSRENPCDGLALANFLKKHKHILKSNYENQVPRVLRADCKRIGIVLK